MHLNSFNHFRAIAITFIVAGHCFGLTGMAITSMMEKTIANLLLGGTSLFVFISGFLFHHIFSVVSGDTSLNAL
jgi:peptidoglycan/LPS O-acetylase OafA/YrhL